MNLLGYLNFIIFFHLLINFPYGCPEISHDQNTSKASSDTDFDILIFSLNWPQTRCYQWKKMSPGNNCSMTANNEWSIHGIWPTQFGKFAPFYCNESLGFNLTDLESIKDELKSKWVDTRGVTEKGDFWKLEWNKHGTCAVVIPELNTQLKYFQKALSWFDQYNMKNLLAKSDILPGKAYSEKAILDGITKMLNVTGQVLCLRNPKTNETYILETRICFDKQLNLANCGDIAEFPIYNCNNSLNVIYLDSVPNEVLQI